MGRRRNNISSSIFRFILSVVILSAFVIGIALFVKGLHTVDEDKIAEVSTKVLSKANIDVEEEKIGEVAGKFIERLSNTNISATSTSRLTTDEEPKEDKEDKSKLLVEIALVSDVQEDLAALERTLNIIKERNINKVVVVGDLTNYGELDDLNDVKNILDESGLSYYAIPGDHDLAASLNADNFTQVFEKDNYVLDIEGFKFIFLDNSANFTPLIPSDISWFEQEVTNTDFIIMSQPLFTEGLNLPFSKMYMGSTREEPKEDLIENQERVKSQRDTLLNSVRESQVSAIFAGDHHKADELVDPERDGLTHYTLGAIAEEVNDLPQRLIQSPRFSILKIYDNKSYDVEEVTID